MYHFLSKWKYLLKWKKIRILTNIFLPKFFDTEGVLRDVGGTFLDSEDFKLI